MAHRRCDIWPVVHAEHRALAQDQEQLEPQQWRTRHTLAAFTEVLTRTTSAPAPLATRLVEAFVHAEDMCRPLGISRNYPVVPAVKALTYQLKTTVKMGGGRERAEGWRLIAVDTDFQSGTGPEVRGNSMALLLAVSGRPVGADELTGSGAVTFAQQFLPA